jgi:hypothetical protein
MLSMLCPFTSVRICLAALMRSWRSWMWAKVFNLKAAYVKVTVAVPCSTAILVWCKKYRRARKGRNRRLRWA